MSVRGSCQKLSRNEITKKIPKRARLNLLCQQLRCCAADTLRVQRRMETTSRSATITTGFCLFLLHSQPITQITTMSTSCDAQWCISTETIIYLNEQLCCDVTKLWRGLTKPSKRPREFLSACLKIHHNSSNYYPLKDLWRGLTKPSKRPREFLSACLKIRHNSSNYYPLKDVIPFMALKEELIGKILLPAMEKYFEQIFQQMALMSPQLPSDLSPTLFLQTSPDLPSCMVASIPDTLTVSPTQVVSPFSAEVIRSGEEIVTDDNGGLVLRDQEGRTRTLFGKKASFIQVDASKISTPKIREGACGFEVWDI
ncbi:hypothetical protein PROFUN_04317 [Planoprotostelium fungivorum]|uniref:Uncharacterized protein n=1 Tax=Planoprotostelium fungivorum TaxID=1890364 RepID=A0A2P6NV44_9EUKA|nr:hypothetical protein PROFUN_04317 [Planoprotostelium fungivorum]